MIKFYITLLLAVAILPQIASAQCFKTSLHFDGIYNAESTSNDHVDITTYGPMSTIESGVSYTIEAWVKRGVIDNPGGYERIISKDLIYQFRIINNQFVGEIGTSSVQTPYPADTLWHHLAFVRNAAQGTLSLYIDGQLRASAADNSTSIPNNNAMVCIGARNNGTGTIDELWKGNIRWLRMSKVARYLSNFTSIDTFVKDDQTLALWPFDEGYGTSLNDRAGYNTGKIVNATWITESPTLPPSLSAQSTSICAGLSTRITASNCTGSVAWGTGESGNYIIVNPYATTTYSARCISESGCPSNATELTISVEGFMPSISIAANLGAFIQKGETVTFTATSTHGGLTPVYQWRKNGTVVGTNSPNYTDSQFNSGDSIRCILTSNAPCRQLDKVVSNEIKILIPELTANGTCGENSLALNNLPYTEIRWKKNGQYIENPVPGNRGSGVTVAGNPGNIILNEGSIFMDEANAVFVSSNQGILKIEPNGREDIVIPIADIKHFFRTRGGSFFLPYQDRVEKWEIGATSGTVVAGGNGIGTNADQLSLSPSYLPSIQVTESGIIYIADTGNKRIQRWNPGASEGVTVAQGDKVSSLFFVDSGNNLFTASNGIIYKWIVNTSNPVPAYSYQNLHGNGTSLALKGDDKGNLYFSIYNYNSTYIYRFNAHGVVPLFSTDGINTYGRSVVYGLNISLNNEIYINTSSGEQCCDGIYKWNSVTSIKLIRDRRISNETNMVAPNDLFVSGRGDIFTWNNDRVQKWSPGSTTGITVAGGNGLGSTSNQLNQVADVGVDKDANVYVSDKNNHRVQRWSPGSTSGVTVAGGNGQGTAANQLTLPGKIFVDSNKNLFIADKSRIQKWSNNSVNGITVLNISSDYILVKEDTIFAAGIKLGPGASVGISLCGPTNQSYNDIHLDRFKNFVYSSYGQYKNFVYDALVRRWSPTFGPSNECMPAKIDTLTSSVYTPTGIFIDSLNNLYVADTQRKKIQKFLSTSPTLTDTTGGSYTAEVTIGSQTLTLNATPGNNGNGLCESIASGDWTNPALWTCGRVPLACDQVIIDVGHTVTLAAAVQISGLEIRQNGNLSLVGGNVQIAKP